MAYRRLKTDILKILQGEDFIPSRLDQLKASARQKVNPLIGFLYQGDMAVRWRSVAALGYVVARMAAVDLEAARVVMRRLMWNLNDESGGMGWGSPEAMAEIMACDARLAEIYAAILLSYIDPRGNYLEHPGLQQGVLWGIGRLGYVRAAWVQSGAAHILPFFQANDPVLRGLAVWAAAPTGSPRLWQKIRSLGGDPSEFMLFIGNNLKKITISELVTQVSAQLGPLAPSEPGSP